MKLSARYIADRYLPDKAIDLMDEASSKVRLGGFKMPEKISELERKIAQLEDDMETALMEQRFERCRGQSARRRKLPGRNTKSRWKNTIVMQTRRNWLSEKMKLQKLYLTGQRYR